MCLHPRQFKCHKKESQIYLDAMGRSHCVLQLQINGSGNMSELDFKISFANAVFSFEQL
jgi:hypothetical protein